MQIDLSTKLLKMDGTLLTEVSRGGEDGITLRTIVSNAMQSVFPNDRSMGMAEKEKLFSLLLRLHGEPVLELTDEERKILKERVYQMPISLLVAGQALRLLDGIPVGIRLWALSDEPTYKGEKELIVSEK